MAGGNFWGGDGTRSNPFLIEDAHDLNAVRNNLTAYYKQIDHIDLSTFGNWEPIGTQTNPFMGSYNGNGYKITGLNCNHPNMDFVGLFGCAGDESSSFQTTFDRVTISSGRVVGKNLVGGIIGCITERTFITNCCSLIDVIGEEMVGGILGNVYNNSTQIYIENSYSSGNVSGYSTVGGLVGYAGLMGIIKSYALNPSVSAGTNNVGDIYGRSKFDSSGLSDTYSLSSMSLPELHRIHANGRITQEQAMQRETYESTLMRYNDFWDINDGESYPFLNPSIEIRGIGLDSSGVEVNGLHVGLYDESNQELDRASFKIFDDGKYSLSLKPIPLGELPSSVMLYSDGNFYYPFDNIVDVVGSQSHIINITLTKMEGNTYEIWTPEDLLGIGNEKFPDMLGQYIQKADINMEGYDFYGIGSSNNPFGGTYDGNGFKISNVKVLSKTDDDGQGFINYVLAGSNHNFNLFNITIDNINVQGDEKECIGSLIGYIELDNWGIGTPQDPFLKAEIYNCHVTNGNILGAYYVGGLVGFFEAGEYTNIKMHKCSFKGETYADDYAALLIGYFDAYLEEGSTWVIENCYVHGTVGEVGTYMDGYNGGFIGQYSAGGDATGYVIKNCYSATKFITESSSNNGAFICEVYADNPLIVAGCYYDADLAEISPTIVDNDNNMVDTSKIQGKTTEEMKQKATFVNWDFDKIWRITEGVTYPLFSNGTSIQCRALPIKGLILV